MKALVTGGTGFIGSHLVKKFVDEGFRVVVAARGKSPSRIPKELQRRVTMLSGDLADETFCEKAVKGCDLVSHLACVVSPGSSNAERSRFWAANAGGTANILKASHAAHVSRFHYMSGPSLVGNVPFPKKASESWRIPPPVSPYSQVKLMGELYCRRYFERYDLPVVITRPFNVYGPSQSPNAKGAMIVKFILNVLEGKPLQIHGDGEQSRDWLYVTDLVDAIYRCLTVEGIEGETFHIATGTDSKVSGVAGLVARVCDPKYQVPVRYLKDRTIDIQRSCGNPAKARRLLGWVPSVNLRQGIRLTCESLTGRSKKL